MQIKNGKKRKYKTKKVEEIRVDLTKYVCRYNSVFICVILKTFDSVFLKNQVFYEYYTIKQETNEISYIMCKKKMY